MISFAIDGKYWQRWILFAIICSLCIHGLVFYVVRHVSIHLTEGQQNRLTERVNSMQAAAAAQQIKKEAVTLRTQVLAKIFQALAPVPVEEVEAPVFEMEREVIALHESPANSSIEKSKLPYEMGNDVFDPAELGILTPNFETSMHRLTLEELKPLKLDHQMFGEELIEAAKPMFGAIVAEKAEPLVSPDSLTIGGLEMTPFQGNSFKEQAGVIGLNLHEFSELEVSGRQLLMSTADMENLKTVLLEHFKNPMHETFLAQLKNEFSLLRVLEENMPLLKNPSEETSVFFTFKIEYAPKRDLTGYLFKLELTPKAEYAYKRIPQNYFFLIDRSPSIGRQRYEQTKSAVMRSLDLLHVEDSFNILVFDGNVTRFSTHGVACSPNNISLAKKFLSAQKHSRFFGSTDLGSSLGHILAMEAKENAVNNAILLSDGDTLLSISKQRKTVANWTAKNQGKIALYSLPAGHGNNLPLLDLLSVFNKGMLFHAASDQAIESTLSMLLYALQNPVARDVIVKANPLENTQGSIKVFPSSQRLPHFYKQIPYVLYGSVDRLEDFNLSFQGNVHDGILSANQQISFANGIPVNIQTLERPWAIQQAYELYAQYLRDGQKQHLQRIKSLLTPYRISMAFQ